LLRINLANGCGSGNSPKNSVVMPFAFRQGKIDLRDTSPIGDELTEKVVQHSNDSYELFREDGRNERPRDRADERLSSQ
jgi:hypothetical protein